MNKYITITEIPGHWWVPKEMPGIIEKLEDANPNYEFVQVVTSPGNGGYREYVIMKLNRASIL